MIETRVFDINPETGVKKLFHYDHASDDGRVTIETQIDCTDIIEQNKALANDGPSLGRGEWNKVASIPMALYFDLKKQFGNDQERWRKWLNDRDNRLFRTRLGRL